MIEMVSVLEDIYNYLETDSLALKATPKNCFLSI